APWLKGNWTVNHAEGVEVLAVADTDGSRDLASRGSLIDGLQHGLECVATRISRGIPQAGQPIGERPPITAGLVVLQPSKLLFVGLLVRQRNRKQTANHAVIGVNVDPDDWPGTAVNLSLARAA